MATVAPKLFKPDIGSMTLYAYQLIGLRPTSIIQEHIESARMATNMLLSRWSAEGVVIQALSPTPEAAGTSPDEACVIRVSSASGREVWLASDAGRWVARRLASPSAGTWVIGPPATLGDWRAALGASGGIASRSPGPSLARRWPDDLHRVDREGALSWHSSAPDVPTRARNGPTRWWHPGSP